MKYELSAAICNLDPTRTSVLMYAIVGLVIGILIAVVVLGVASLKYTYDQVLLEEVEKEYEETLGTKSGYCSEGSGATAE